MDKKEPHEHWLTDGDDNQQLKDWRTKFEQTLLHYKKSVQHPRPPFKRFELSKA